MVVWMECFGFLGSGGSAGGLPSSNAQPEVLRGVVPLPVARDPPRLQAPDDLGGPCSFGQRALARLVQQAALWQETRELARLGIQTVPWCRKSCGL